MLGLTTTRHLNAVRTSLEQQLTRACLAAELDRARTDRARARERTNLRRRLDRAVAALAATRRELSTTQGALHRVSEKLLDQRTAARP